MTLILTVRVTGTQPGDPLEPYSVENDMIVVGRSKNCDWHLPDPTNAISSRHAEIRREGEAWLLKDISTNGTYLDRAKVTTAVRVPLRTPIRVGKTVIELRP